MKKLYLYILLIVVAVGATGYFLLSGSAAKDMKFRTDKVTRGDVVVQVRATGTINPDTTVDVGSQVSGMIARLNVDFNSVVRKGQIIAIIDSTFLFASEKQAEANLERAQAEISQDKNNYDRTKELFDKQLAAQADLDAATATYDAAVASKKQAQAALDMAKVNLTYAVIRAPINGIVISRNVDVGQTVAASLQAPTLFQIANDLRRMQVQASVDEADIGQIKGGQQVTFTVDAYPEEQFQGIVSQIRLQPITVQNVVTYTVIIEVQNPDLKLRPGMTATVSILVDKRENVLRVPSLALRFQPPEDILEKLSTKKPGDSTAASKDMKQAANQQPSDTGRAWHRKQDAAPTGGAQQPGEKRHQRTKVWVLQNGKTLKPISVIAGLNDNRYAEIKSDELKEGDDVVLSINGQTVAGQQNPFQPQGMGGGPRRM